MSEPVISERALGDCQYRHDWIGGRCNTCGCRMDWDELNQKACAAEAKVAELTPLLSNAIRERNKYDAECDRLEAKVEELEQEKEEMRKVLENSEQYRRAYQAGKIELYSMGEPFTGAAMQHLPCGEGELDRRFTKLIEMPRLVAQQSLIRELGDKLQSINRILSPGHRTLDDLLRDMGYACDVARCAIEKLPKV